MDIAYITLTAKFLFSGKQHTHNQKGNGIEFCIRYNIQRYRDISKKINNNLTTNMLNFNSLYVLCFSHLSYMHKYSNIGLHRDFETGTCVLCNFSLLICMYLFVEHFIFYFFFFHSHTIFSVAFAWHFVVVVVVCYLIASKCDCETPVQNKNCICCCQNKIKKRKNEGKNVGAKYVSFDITIHCCHHSDEAKIITIIIMKQQQQQQKKKLCSPNNFIARM